MELRKFKIRENLILRIAILFNNIDFLLKCGIPVNVRINSDLYTINKIHDLLSFFEDKGWYKYKNFRAYCALLRQEVDVKQQIQHSQMGQLDLLKYYNDKIKNNEITERKIFYVEFFVIEIFTAFNRFHRRFFREKIKHSVAACESLRKVAGKRTDRDYRTERREHRYHTDNHSA